MKSIVVSTKGKLGYAEYLFTHQPCVIRLIPKATAPPTVVKKLEKEMQVMSQMDHPNILQVYEVVEDATSYYLISEAYIAGEFERAVKQPLPEGAVACILEQVLSALCYCHTQGVVHRSLSLGALVLQTVPEHLQDIVVKVANFSEAAFLSSEQDLKAVVGPTLFIAPEVMKRNYSEKCDIWSSGVLAFYLLSGHYPFTGATPAEVLQQVARAEVRYLPEEGWASVSAPAQDFVTSLLQLDPAQRPSALVALSHPWLIAHSRRLPPASKEVRKSLGKMLSLQTQAVLRQAAMNFIVTRVVDRSDLSALREAFRALDLNGDGQISEGELREGLSKMLPPVQAEMEAKRVMALADANMNGAIDYSEFVISAFPEGKLHDTTTLSMVFESFDADGSGTISMEELKQALQLQSEGSDEVWAQLVKEMDTSGDGQLNFQEFVQAMKKALSN